MASSPDGDEKKQRGIAMADRIKAHHQNLIRAAQGETATGAGSTADATGNRTAADPVAAWEKMKATDAAALRQYAEDMYTLATQHWQHGADAADRRQHSSISYKKPESSGNKNAHTDRLLYIADVIQQYFTMQRDPATASHVKPPSSAAAAVAAAAASSTSADTASAPARRDRDEPQEQPAARAAEGDAAGGKYVTIPGYRLPGVVAAAVKSYRKEIWDATRAAPTEAGTDAAALQAANAVLERMFSTRNDSDVEKEDERRAAVELRIVDVGSCYNPLRHVFLNEDAEQLRFWPCSGAGRELALSAGAEWLRLDPVVVGLDLCPHESSGVFQCDWFSIAQQQQQQQQQEQEASAKMSFDEIVAMTMARPSAPNDDDDDDGDNDSRSAAPIAAAERQARLREIACAQRMFSIVPPVLREAAPTSPSAVSIAPATRLGSKCHVVTFCLLLSYLPSPAMRLRCCWNARELLLDDGLFVVVSTRTQNNRQTHWEDLWVQRIEALGFERFRKDIRIKLVGMAFRKIAGGAPARFEDLPAELREGGLPIGADSL